MHFPEPGRERVLAIAGDRTDGVEKNFRICRSLIWCFAGTVL